MVKFEDLDISLGDGYFLRSYEVDPEGRWEDSSFTATGLGGRDTIVASADPVLDDDDMDIIAMTWGDADGNVLHCWPEEDVTPEESYFKACHAHAERTENKSHILDIWTENNS